MGMFHRKWFFMTCLLSPIASFVFYLLCETWVRTMVVIWDDAAMRVWEWFHAVLVCSAAFCVARLARRDMCNRVLSGSDRDFVLACSCLPLLWTVVPLYAILFSDAEGAARAIEFLYKSGLPILRNPDEWLGEPEASKLFWGVCSIMAPYAAAAIGALFPAWAYEKDA